MMDYQFRISLDDFNNTVGLSIHFPYSELNKKAAAFFSGGLRKLSDSLFSLKQMDLSIYVA